jgi:integrase
MAGKTRVSVKTKKPRGKAVVRGGAGTATRTVGLLGGILTYAVETGIIESNPAHGIRKPKDNVRKRRLSEAEYRILGGMLREAAKQEKYTTIVDIIRQIALTGSRRSEMIGLKWTEADTEEICLRLEDSKEGESIRPIGLLVVEYLERRRTDDLGTYVFPGRLRTTRLAASRIIGISLPSFRKADIWQTWPRRRRTEYDYREERLPKVPHLGVHHYYGR